MGSREAEREALTGEGTGQVLSSEIRPPGRRPCPNKGKATRTESLSNQRQFGPAESKTLSMCGNSMHENREVSAVPV